MSIAVEVAAIKGATIAVPVVKATAAAAAGSVGLPVILAVGAIMGLIYLASNPKKKNEEEEIAENKLKERDLVVIQYLEKEDCENITNLEELKKLVEEVFFRNPEKKVFIEGLYEKCVEKAKNSKKTDWVKIGTKATATILSLAGAKKALEEFTKLSEEERKKIEEQDKYILDKLSAKECGTIVNPEKYKQLVTQTFLRNPAQGIWLEGQYLKCLEQSMKA